MPKAKTEIELKEQIKNQVIELIGNNQTEEALVQLDQYLNQTKSPQRKNLALLRSRQTELNRQKMGNLIAEEDAQITQNGINEDILQMAEDIGHKKTIHLDPVDTSSVVKPVLIIGGVIVVALLLVIAVSSLLTSLRGDSSENQPVENTENTDNNVTEIAPDVNKDDLIADYVEVELVHLISDFELIYVDSVNQKWRELKKEAKKLNSRLNNIPDAELQLHSVIYKHIGLSISNNMLGFISTKKEDQIKNGGNAKASAEAAEKAIAKIKDLEDPEYKADLEYWVIDQEHKRRAEILKFLAMAQIHLAGGDINKYDLKSFYRQLDQVLLKKEGYLLYPIFKELEKQSII